MYLCDPDCYRDSVALSVIFFKNLHREKQRNTEIHRVFLKSMITIPNLLLIAGTGTKSGKTSVACRIISQLPELKITAIKITPHFHETTSGLLPVTEGKGYAIYEETERHGFKDTSRMLDAGAARVYFAKVWDDQLFDVFIEIMKTIPENTPVICESPALRNFAEPGVFVIMNSGVIHKHKDITHLTGLPHVLFQYEALSTMSSIPVSFGNGSWQVM